MGNRRKQREKGKRDHQLREAAEKKLAQTPSAVPEIREKNPEELIHELQVHQIELEMQNEELRRVQIALEESRDKYIDLYDFAPIGYFTLTHEALIAEVNLTGAALLGVDHKKLINGRFRRFVVPEDLDRWDRHIVSVFQQGEKQSCDLALKREDGSTFHAQMDSIRMEVIGGTTVVRTAVSDITERRRIEEERRKLIYDLQDALTKIKKLRGLLPICASCKKIRDDKGYWNQLETYIQEHSEAEFSHGICPDCMKKLYGVFLDEDTDSKKQ